MRYRIPVALAFALFAAAAAAQDRTPEAVDPKACAPGERLSPPRDGSTVTTGSAENLSDKLARTDGVLCPPNVDPAIKAPTPDAGRTPVIPPPGSPGGDPSVRPK